MTPRHRDVGVRHVGVPAGLLVVVGVVGGVVTVVTVRGIVVTVVGGGVVGVVLSVVGDILGLVVTVVVGAVVADVERRRSGAASSRGGGGDRARPALAGGRRTTGERLRPRWWLHECRTVGRLADYLLDRAGRRLPEAFRDRFAEEWQDHRTHYRGWRLLWWAFCVRATAFRTAGELQQARLPRPDR
jgi:hypothetical protein